MGPFKSASARSVNKDGNVYFELHKLWSEQQRLEQMRAHLSERIRHIDAQLAEIAKAMDAIDPRRGQARRAEVRQDGLGKSD